MSEKCPFCGREVERAQVQCPRCGTMLVRKKESEEAAKVCTGCGKKLEEGQQFCPECGTLANRDQQLDKAKRLFKEKSKRFPKDQLALIEHQIETMSPEQAHAFMSVKFQNTINLSHLLCFLSSVGISVYAILMREHIMRIRGTRIFRWDSVSPSVDIDIWVGIIIFAGLGLGLLWVLLFHAWDRATNFRRVLPYLNLSESAAPDTVSTRPWVVTVFFVVVLLGTLVAMRAFYLDQMRGL